MNTLDTTLENDMRDWLKDCYEEPEDHEEIDELTYEQLVKAVNRYYDGGFKAFINN